MPASPISRLLRTLLPALLTLLLLAAAPLAGSAQSSLVPAQHPVYDWLHRQRILGRIEGFVYEARPVSRGTIEGHLREVEAHQGELGGADRALLAAYWQEFSREGMERAAEENWLRGEGPVHRRFVRMFAEQREPHLFAWTDSVSSYAVDVYWGEGLLAGEESAESFRTLLNEKGARAFADFFGHVGLHVEMGNLSALSDVRGVRFDPLYNKSMPVVLQGKGNSLYHEATASAVWRPLGLHIGHGALHFGPGRDASLFVSRDGPVFDWIRFDMGLRWLRYTALHGSMASDVKRGTLILDGDTIQTRRAPQRWLVVHRAEILPWPSFRIAFSEILTYSDQGVDYAYLNPLAPAFFSERDNEDRDNVLGGIDVTWRPLAGLELYGSVIVDEMQTVSDIARVLTDDEVHGAVEAGLSSALPGGWDAELRYLRIDPWVWTHKQRLNAVEQRGFPLAHPLGPNADSRSVWLRRWFPRRAWLAVGLAHQRKGLNPVGANVGGDVTMESRAKPPLELFEGADLQTWRAWSLEGAVEPWRGLHLELRWERRESLEGTRMPDRNLVDLRLLIGF